MTNSLLKLNAMHKIIMAEIQGEVVVKSGVLKAGWKKGDHIQHTSDILQDQIIIFQRQLANVYKDLELNNKESLQKSLSMYQKDREKLKFNIQNDKIDKDLFDEVQLYVECLNDAISMILEYLDQ